MKITDKLGEAKHSLQERTDMFKIISYAPNRKWFLTAVFLSVIYCIRTGISFETLGFLLIIWLFFKSVAEGYAEVEE